MAGRAGWAILLLVFATGRTATATEAPPEPGEYRLDDYRAPTPRTLAGATVIDTPAAERLWRERAAIFIDVMPRTERPPNLPAGTIWRDKRRDNIPGSVWLANTGYGALNEVVADFFARSLESLSGGQRDKPLVLYCQRNCWMSWNAAKRALSLGYGRVHWYPDGTDGWAEAGLPLEEASPLPPSSG